VIDRGRFFTVQEELQASQVAVLGPVIADQLFPGADPLGRTVRVAGRGFRVIGLQQRQGNVAGSSLDRNVWISLLLEAVILCLIGGAAGLLLAAAVTALLTLVLPDFLPVLPAWAVAFGLGSSCLTGVLAGYLPARQAARLDPVEALRYEGA
jgi:ABC-type antimicrobial peptide transport system permease subunit